MNIFKNAFIFANLLLLLLLSCQFVLRIKNLNKSELPSFKNSIGIDFLEIPSGDFRMGCSSSDANCDEDELPAKNVKISSAYYLGKYEITKAEFSIFISESSYKTDAETMGFANTWRNCHGMKQQENHPVICVSWNDAKQFTKWLSSKEGKKYRLPTEAEWEYAARADFFTRYYWGMDMDAAFAWYNKNSNKATHPVGTKNPNSWGLFDMSGNVSEWCEDDYDPNYFKKKENQSPILRKVENSKALRGGSWFDSFLLLRVSARAFAPKEARENSYGFRVVTEK